MPAPTKRKTLGRVQFYRDRTRQWRWRVFARNGRELANSGEGYRRLRDCQRGYQRTVEAMLYGTLAAPAT